MKKNILLFILTVLLFSCTFRKNNEAEATISSAEINVKTLLLWGYRDQDGDTILFNQTLDMIKGEEKMNPVEIYDKLTTCHYSDTRFIVTKNNKMGITDIDGQLVIPIEYDDITNWLEYIDPVHFVKKDDKVGMISTEGKLLIPVIYDELYYFSDSCVIVKKDRKIGIVNTKNEIVISLEYDGMHAGFFWDETYKALFPDSIYVKKDGRYFIIDRNNKVISDTMSERMKECFHETLMYIPPPPPPVEY